MSFDAWPSPQSRRGPLPRIEDLPVREQGYDQEAVRRAFDDFYRHAAQLDASLNALEGVAAFQRDAAQLRADLRALRGLGLGGSDPGWTGSSAWASERLPSDVPVTALRIAGEAGLLIAVAVVAGVSHLRTWVIVALMAAALVVVWLCEWLAARARTRVPSSVYEPVAFTGYAPVAAETDGEPAPYVEGPALDVAVGWSAFEPLAEVDEVAALTSPEPAEDTAEDVEPVGDPGDESAKEMPASTGPAEDAAAEPADAKPQRSWLRRRRREEQPAEAGTEPAPEPPTHVRVLTPGDDAPWERGFDGEPVDERQS